LNRGGTTELVQDRRRDRCPSVRDPDRRYYRRLTGVLAQGLPVPVHGDTVFPV